MRASSLLEKINSPADLRRLERKLLPQLATELRAFLILSLIHISEPTRPY